MKNKNSLMAHTVIFYIIIVVSFANADDYPSPSIGVMPISGKNFVCYYSSSKVLSILNVNEGKRIEINMPDRVIGLFNLSEIIVVYTLDGKILFFDDKGNELQNYENAVKGLVISGVSLKKKDSFALLVSIEDGAKNDDLKCDIWFGKYDGKELNFTKNNGEFPMGSLVYLQNKLLLVSKKAVYEIAMP